MSKETNGTKRRYSIGEEIGNAVTHGVGAGLSIAGLVLLIIRATLYAPVSYKALYVVGFTLFGSSLVILYLFSTLYHALPLGAKKIFGIFDHISIYILIAGTYTGFCMGPLHKNGLWLLIAIWSIALIGIIFYAIFGSKVRILSVITYVVMGWLVIAMIKPIRAVLPRGSFVFLLIGGVCYTLGCVFYAMKKHKWMHFVWHLFVMAGSLCHFFSLFFSV
ncbi:MAG: PAQR family membrane homeostasis protein TrhA [Treponema sp.]